MVFMKKRNPFAIISMIIILCILIAMIVQLLPLIDDILSARGDEASIVEYVNSLGWRGVPALIGLAALQVIIIILPAPVIGVLAGLSYGVYWGPLIFLGGLAIGNMLVVFYMRQLGSLFKRKPKHNADQKRKKLLSKEQLDKIKRPEIVALFLPMIPFLSGMGPYLFAETNVSLPKYTIAVVAGNIPSAVLYVFLGDRISRGSHTTAIVTAVIVVAALAILLPFRKKIIAKIIDEGNS